MRILVADDDPLVREFVGLVLRNAGHYSVQVKNGLEALAEFEKQPFQLALIDLIMPEQEGIATIVQIRRGWPDARIIAMSAGSQSLSRSTALDWAVELGADLALTKPIDPAELLRVITEQATLVSRDTGLAD
jgi:DNA-binding response OmpR family regulator